MERSLLALLVNEYLKLVSDIAKKLQVSAYFVGGGLRDTLMGRKVKDYDFALSGGYEEFPAEFAKTVGGSFFWLDRQRCQSRVVLKYESGTLVFDFGPLRGNDIMEDLLLRDFTINALAMSMSSGSGSVIDPLRGVTDILLKTIRACSGDSFDDDPLRLLRALRFAATLGFDVEPGTWRQLCDKAHLLQGCGTGKDQGRVFSDSDCIRCRRLSGKIN